jgi:hypothetical protein
MKEDIKRWIVWTILLTAFILGVSCSPKQRLSRIIRKNPHLIDTITRVKSDTFYLSGIKKDTVTLFKVGVRDSIIFKDKTQVKYLIRRDTIEIEVKCPDQILIKDSVFVDKFVKVEPTLKESAKRFWFIPLIISILFVLLTFIFIRK